MARHASLSGFPELLPQERIVEQSVLDSLRRTFELHGFSSVETRSVETVEQLLRKGEIDKEVYAVNRLQAEEGEREAALALHFDLTVPFARYVVENAGYLSFPFRRYQIQKSWRGERPQEGRAREFTQADFDIVTEGELPLRYDAELVLLAARSLMALPIPATSSGPPESSIPPVQLRLSNRKLAEGFFAGLGIQDTAVALRAVDKLEKIGPRAVAQNLITEAQVSEEDAEKVLAFAQIRSTDSSFVDQVLALGVDSPLLQEGLTELSQVLEACQELPTGTVIADLSIARGLDYYTGTVMETTLVGHEALGSICSGGRYDALARKGNRVFPGVGMSIGVTRLVARMLSQELAIASRAVPTAVYIALTDDADWQSAQQLAEKLRGRGIAAEVAVAAEKFGKQIKYADRRGIPYVWFLGDGEKQHEVKDIRSGEQSAVDPDSWQPPAEDLKPQIISNTTAATE